MGLSDFQIINKIGEGAYSSVWKVRRISDGQEYALKKIKLASLSEKEKQNSVNEVRILASIQDPTIVAYKEAFIEENSLLCIIMEYAAGGDLYNKILEHTKAKTYFKEEEVWNYAVQMIQGLRTLHEMKILHRDLKCANIFLDADGKGAKLGDLNVSKVLKNNLVYTQTGTPYYASPEVWRDEPYDSKSDMWSLGCVIYEMAALKPPFRAKDMEGLYKKVQRGSFDRIPEHYSNDLATIIGSCLKVSATMRPTCQQLLKHSIIQRHGKEFIERANVTPSISALLSTIRFPKNIRTLGNILPKPNYFGIQQHTDSRKLPKIASKESNLYLSHGYGPSSRIQTTVEEDKVSLKHNMSAESKVLRLDTKAGRAVERESPLRALNEARGGRKVSEFIVQRDNSLLLEKSTAAKVSNRKPSYHNKLPKGAQILTAKKTDGPDEYENKLRSVRSKSTIPMISENSSDSLKGTDLGGITVLENGKVVVNRDNTPNKILSKQNDVASSYRNRGNMIVNKYSSKRLVRKMYDESAYGSDQRSIVGRHVISNRAQGNKSVVEGDHRSNDSPYRQIITEAPEHNYSSLASEARSRQAQNTLEKVDRAGHRRTNNSQSHGYKNVVEQILPREISESVLKKKRPNDQERL